MSPSEYQELTAFFIERLDRYQRETRADSQETRSFVGVTVESLRHEIRIVADGVLGNGRRIDETHRLLDENTRVLDEHGRRLDENTRAVDALTERVGRLQAAV